NDEILEAVTKDSSSRLRNELARAQSALKEADVEDLTRSQLIRVVCALRGHQRTTESVKVMTTFIPQVIKASDDVFEPVGKTQTGINDMFANMMKLMLDERKESEKIRREERQLAEKETERKLLESEKIRKEERQLAE